MKDLDVERDALRKAHQEVFAMVPKRTGDMSADYDALVAALGTEDVWYTFDGRPTRSFTPTRV
jgi:hypothetical protein